ncbi:MAG: lytic transglycosylase domain-containing protein [Oscillospiraceae bacterium]|jgi:soluble lytic murein transglycosylase|nr:lytic transglycosylase domain-containing protein [Oscillospiraceae bacterium]
MKGLRPIVKDVLLAVVVVVIGGAALAGAYKGYYRAAYPVKYIDTVLAQSEKNGLSPSLVYAVIRTESGFRPGVRSSVGATGLMQITKDTFDWTQYRLGETPKPMDILYDGEENIKYGAALLRLLIDEFGSVENALCAYHAGWGNVKRWLDNPDYAPDGYTITRIPFGDTARYVKKVLETRDMYERLYD